MFEFFSCEGVVLMHELEIVGQVGGVGALGLHVSLKCFLLSLAFERDGELE